MKNIFIRFIDLWTDTHITKVKYIDFSYIDMSDIDLSNINMQSSEYLCDMYLSHCFDLLGSGYVNVTYDMNCQGLDGNIYEGSLHITNFDIQGNWLNKVLRMSHLKFAKNIWHQMDREYVPIDWQMDFKSGFRYSQKKWYLDQPIGEKIGVDIKVPWELGRLQHLPQLAVFAILFPDKRKAILREFRNQVSDFIMANPPRMGVQWRCTMDVSIRAANMLIAFDMLGQLDEFNILDEDFKILFNAIIYEHGSFIMKNLEWYDGLTSNHYLSDICGLAFVGAYLRRDEKTDSWLAFSVQEIISETFKQFNEDGSNFEGSTSYHRLSGELLVYTTALIYGFLKTTKRKALIEYKSNSVKRLLPISKQSYDVFSQEFFPKEYIERIYRSALFTVDITKRNGNICQIGDNDSGRFFKFSPSGEFLSHSDAIKKYTNLKYNKPIKDIYFDENILNHDTFISAVNGFFEDEKFCRGDKFSLEKSIIVSLYKGKKLKSDPFCNDVNINKGMVPALKYNFEQKIQFSDYTSEVIDTNNIQYKHYPYFGIYIFRSENFYLSVMAGERGQNGSGGHGHNDVLSYELSIAGIDIYVDPGTYLYTPEPKIRNKFRSVKAHNVPIIEDAEQCKFTGIFSRKNEIVCEVLKCDCHNLTLYATYRDTKILREFIINTDNLIIIDKCNSKFYENDIIGEAVSNGYGKLMQQI
ncbi:alginate lyase family protein [Clostridium sp.]|uniref:alginate lyase family protein n=1 Tax=Clostridium sp. TaxID=1506 RepID=UPI0025BEF5FB|nr:alginate lyase family protein [Clostridium sp.]